MKYTITYNTGAVETFDTESDAFSRWNDIIEAQGELVILADWADLNELRLGTWFTIDSIDFTVDTGKGPIHLYGQ